MSRADLAVRSDLSPFAIKARISELRTTMETEAIDTTTAGYALTEVGMRECRQAFAAMVNDLSEVAA